MKEIYPQFVTCSSSRKCHDKQCGASHAVTMTLADDKDFIRLAGQRLKVVREALDLTQEKLAEALGVTRSAVNNWEKGIRMPGPAAMSRMAGRYGISLDWIYRGDMSGLRVSLAEKIGVTKAD